MSNFFSDVSGPIPYVGPESDELFGYRWYDKDRVVGDKTMADHLRIAVCYWHSFASQGSDIFGDGTFDRPWFDPSLDPKLAARVKMGIAFEFFEKLGTPYYCFHDHDLAPEGQSFAEETQILEDLIEDASDHMDRTGVKLLWGTARLFSHPRFMSGAATNPDPEVFARAAAQVKNCMDATHRLGGENYVLWGGREGYDTLLNTDVSRELDQLGRFLTMVVEYKHAIGFEGTILLEPKPHEPTKHQYDHDTQTVHSFLQRYDLEHDVKVNIEVNHATLAGHDFAHEVAMATASGIFGSVDANRGDDRLGWDTDQFPNSVDQMSLGVYEILRGGGLTTGGFNFDAKLRRQSTRPSDLFHAHIGGVDVLARSLLVAHAMLEDGALEDLRAERYAGWDTEFGRGVLAGEHTLADLHRLVDESNLDPAPRSGRQEELENLVNRYIERVS